MMLNLLIAKVQGQNGTGGSVFDKCDLKLRYLHANNGLSTDWDFEMALPKSSVDQNVPCPQPRSVHVRISELIPFRTVTMKQMSWWTVVKGITF